MLISDFYRALKPWQDERDTEALREAVRIAERRNDWRSIWELREELRLLPAGSVRGEAFAETEAFFAEMVAKAMDSPQGHPLCDVSELFGRFSRFYAAWKDQRDTEALRDAVQIAEELGGWSIVLSLWEDFASGKVFEPEEDSHRAAAVLFAELWERIDRWPTTHPLEAISAVSAEGEKIRARFMEDGFWVSVDLVIPLDRPYEASNSTGHEVHFDPLERSLEHYRGQRGTTTGEIWLGRVFEIAEISADAVSMIPVMAGLLDSTNDLETIIDGFEEYWDGSNHRGRLITDDANEAVESFSYVEHDNVQEYWEPGDWFQGGHPGPGTAGEIVEDAIYSDATTALDVGEVERYMEDFLYMDEIQSALEGRGYAVELLTREGDEMRPRRHGDTEEETKALQADLEDPRGRVILSFRWRYFNYGPIPHFVLSVDGIQAEDGYLHTSDDLEELLDDDLESFIEDHFEE